MTARIDKADQSSDSSEVQRGVPTRWSLIARLKNPQDEASWRQFYDIYGKLIQNVGLRAGLSHSEAEDVVQETTIAVSKNIESFQADPAFGSFKSWLLCLTRWRITDQLRRRQRRRESPCETSLRESVSDDNDRRFNEIWEEEWREHLLNGALDILKREVNARHFQMFYLHVIKKVPASRTARMLNVSAAQVYLIKHRLAGRFKKACQAMQREEEPWSGRAPGR